MDWIVQLYYWKNSLQTLMLMRVQPQLKHAILEFVQSSKNIIDADSNNENEMNNAAPVLTSSVKRNVMKIMRSDLDAYSNGEINNQMGDIEQFVDNLMLKKSRQIKISDYFPNTH
ncbi:uncharacterized protein TNCV_61961 [Trichonephila clavipes]|nr:uncharacterized protein TNCV_61961 [Trichonephila clavipes]